ncbi:uncharacterized protein LOC113788430 isoform X2 [Dermatophagoides pteronyssinus]|uniref:uncharacterized protein LOC113788430 isoform X2 n=1 Tax=Dermatophagoides pteronyssinus TaxID=6956 RepID=UPI003F67C3E7
MACMDFSFDSRIRKKYVPLINQQRYLRHVKRIAARNLFIPEQLLRNKVKFPHHQDDNGDSIVDNVDDLFAQHSNDNEDDETLLYSRLNISFYYTIHYPIIQQCHDSNELFKSSSNHNHHHQDCNCGRLLYRSECLMNNNPSWKVFNGSSLCSPSISQFIVRVYFLQKDRFNPSSSSRNYIKLNDDEEMQISNEIGTLFLEWNVNLTGLLYIGEEFPKDRRLTRNSIIFGFAEGFYTSVCSVASENLLTHSIPPSESLQINDYHLTRDSYCLDTLIRIQIIQCIIQATATQSQLEKSSLEDELEKFRRKQELQSEIEKMKTSIEFLQIVKERRRKQLEKQRKELLMIEEKLCEYNMDMSSNVQKLKQELSILSELRSIKLPEMVRKLLQLRTTLSYHRKLLARKFFSDIYSIEQFPDGQGYSINHIHLPSSQQQFEQHQLKMISIGIGYVAHLVYYLSIVLDVYLFHQIIPFGSNSSILDLYNRLLSPSDRIVPLYLKSKSNLNLKFFKHAKTLYNLYSLYRKRFAYDNDDNIGNDCPNDDTLNRFNTYTPSIIMVDNNIHSQQQQQRQRSHSDDNNFDLDNEKLLRNINEVKINDIMIDSLWKEVEQMTIQSIKTQTQSTIGKKQQQSSSTSALTAIVEEQIKDIISKQRQQKRQHNSEILSQLSSSLSFSRASLSFDILTPNSIRSSVISTSSPQEILRHQQRRFSSTTITNPPLSSSSMVINSGQLSSSSFGSSGSGGGGGFLHDGDHHSPSSSSSFRLNGHHLNCQSSMLFQQFHSIRRSQQQQQSNISNTMLIHGPQSLPSSMNHSFLHPTTTITETTTTAATTLAENSLSNQLPQCSSSSSNTFNNLSLSLDNLIDRNHHNHNQNHRLSIDQNHRKKQFDTISIVHDDNDDDDDDDGITFHCMDLKNSTKFNDNDHHHPQQQQQSIINDNDDDGHST